MNCVKSKQKIEAEITELLLNIQLNKSLDLLNIATALDKISKLAWQEVKECYPPSHLIENK